MPKVFDMRKKIAWNKGKKLPPLSVEHRLKLSKAAKGHVAWNRGKKNIFSLDALKKISAAWKGKKRSEENRLKCSLAKLGDKNPAKRKDVREKMSLAHKGKCVGRANPNWKGGVSSLRKILTTMPEYKEWRHAVFTRDNYTCQIKNCHKRNFKGRGCTVRLEAHHIISLKEMIKKYNITSIKKARLTPALWVVFNGITVCRGCHLLIHKSKEYEKN